MYRAAAMVVWALAWAGAAVAEDFAPRVELTREAQPQRFVVLGLSARTVAALQQADWTQERWQAVFAVRLAGGADLPPLLGQYAVRDGRPTFTPQFPVDAGRTYQIRLRLSELPHVPTGALDREFTVKSAPKPVSDRPATSVVLVTPTVQVLPENQLKFYIHFSAPMSRGEAYRHITLRNEAGEIVSHPFLELPEELWDPELTRFTLFFDPGRIKRGLKPREQFGPPLETGRSYSLHISSDWRDAEGRPLAQAFEKPFRVEDPDDTQPSVDRWKFDWPSASTRDPVVVQFDEPLDHGLLQTMLRVVDDAGRTVAGRAVTSDNDRQWQWEPESAWRSGAYRLAVDTRLEDLAGNSLARPFEVDLFERVERRVIPKVQELPFTVR